MRIHTSSLGPDGSEWRGGFVASAGGGGQGEGEGGGGRRATPTGRFWRFLLNCSNRDDFGCFSFLSLPFYSLPLSLPPFSPEAVKGTSRWRREKQGGEDENMKLVGVGRFSLYLAIAGPFDQVKYWVISTKLQLFI